MSGLPGNCTVPKDFQQVLNRVQKGLLGRGAGVDPQPQQEVAPQQQRREVAPQQQRGSGPQQQRGGGPPQQRGGGPRAYGKEVRDEDDQPVTFQAIPGSALVGDPFEEWGADKEVRPTGRQDAGLPAKGVATPGTRSVVFTGASRGLDQRQVKTRVAYTPPHSGREKGTSEEEISDGEKERRETQKREYRLKKQGAWDKAQRDKEIVERQRAVALGGCESPEQRRMLAESFGEPVTDTASRRLEVDSPAEKGGFKDPAPVVGSNDRSKYISGQGTIPKAAKSLCEQLLARTKAGAKERETDTDDEPEVLVRVVQVSESICPFMHNRTGPSQMQAFLLKGAVNFRAIVEKFFGVTGATPYFCSRLFAMLQNVQNAVMGKPELGKCMAVLSQKCMVEYQELLALAEDTKSWVSAGGSVVNPRLIPMERFERIHSVFCYVGAVSLINEAKTASYTLAQFYSILMAEPTMWTKQAAAISVRVTTPISERGGDDIWRSYDGINVATIAAPAGNDRGAGNGGRMGGGYGGGGQERTPLRPGSGVENKTTYYAEQRAKASREGACANCFKMGHEGKNCGKRCTRPECQGQAKHVGTRCPFRVP